MKQMTLSEALAMMPQQTGATTLIAAVLGGDSGSIEDVQQTSKESVEAIGKKLANVLAAQKVCGSDAAWWGYMGQIKYLESAKKLFEAAALVGPDNLPTVAPPNYDNCVLMDALSRQEHWASKVLSKAEATGVDERTT